MDRTISIWLPVFLTRRLQWQALRERVDEVRQSHLRDLANTCDDLHNRLWKGRP